MGKGTKKRTRIRNAEGNKTMKWLKWYIILGIVGVLLLSNVNAQGFGKCPFGRYPFGKCVVSAPSPKPPVIGGGGGGGILFPENLTIFPFGIKPLNGTCLETQQLFDERCYPCNPEIGYLKFNPNDRSVLCVSCADGFRLNGTVCYQKSKITLSLFVDNIVSKTFNITNTLGYSLILVLFTYATYYSYEWLKKKPPKKETESQE